MSTETRPPVSVAFFWSAVERLGQQVLQFCISIVLARMLSPSEFGLLGILIIFGSLASVFADAGFGSGLIQRKEISRDEETSIFYLNIAAGFVLMLLLWMAAPLVAGFFRIPLLKPLLRVFSLQLVFSAFGIVQYALLMRQVDFRTQAIISTIATLLSGVIGIGMAWRGFGAWSLVGQMVSRAFLNSALVWVMRPWRPVGIFHWACVKSLWPYSSRLMASNVLNTLFDNVYAVIIGRVYRPVDLGYFTRAFSVAQLPALLVQTSVGRVLFPVLARKQDDKQWMKEKFRKTGRALASFHFPVMCGLAAIATPLVKCLLTDKWLPCVPYLKILCFSGLLYPFHAMNLDVLVAQGRSDLFFRLEVIKKIMTALMVVATFRFGTIWMVWGILINSIACYFVNAYYTRAMIDYGWREQGRDLLPILIASLGMGAAVASLNYIAFGNDWLRLAAQIALGVLIYGLLALAGRRGSYADLFSAGGVFWRKNVPTAEG